MKIKYILGLTAIITMASSCSNFLDVNTDPTAQKNAGIALVLTSAEGSLAFYSGSDLYLYSMLFSQQMAGQGSATQTRFYDSYIVTNTDVNNAFSNYYAGTLADLDYIIKNASTQGNPQYAGIAKILQAFTYGLLADNWGSIPFTQALQSSVYPQPKYDDSKAIYDGLFTLIDDGIADLGKTNVRTITTEDLIYGGDLAKWTKFANTLKLRLALHYAKDDNGAKLNSIISAGGPFMTSNADNFQLSFDNVTNRQNPIHQFEIRRADYDFPSAFLINMMTSKNDPRLPYYFTSYPAGASPYKNKPSTGTGTITYTTGSKTVTGSGSSFTTDLVVGSVLKDGTGVLIGTVATITDNATVTLAANSAISGTGAYSIVTPYKGAVSTDGTGVGYSRIHTYLRGAQVSDDGSRTGSGLKSTSITYDGKAPIRMLTFAEYNFIMAEAVQVYSSPGSADTYYKAGINASMLDAGVSQTAIDAYKASAAAVSLQTIIEEKYVASVGVCTEPWTDWRRTGFPAITVNPAAVAAGNTTIPRILVYPLSEQQVNQNNVPARASMSVSGVFWDK